MPVKHEEIHARSHDNLKLFIQRWTPDSAPVRAEVVLIHGYAEHSGRYREFAHALAEQGIQTLAVDLRGHGHSEGIRGHCDAFEHFLHDVEMTLEHAADGVPRFILGHSHGGLVTLDFVVKNTPDISGVILSNPFLGLAMPVPAPKLFAGRLAGNFVPTLAIPSGIDASGLTHDTEIVRRYERDPMVFPTATAGWFNEVERAQDRVKGYRDFPKPLLYLFSDCDPVASPHDNRNLAERLNGDDKTIHVRRGEKHEILNELARHETYEVISQWILQRSPST